MKPKTARELAKLTLAANTASHKATAKALASEMGTPERHILGVKAERASIKLYKYYDQLAALLGHTPDMAEMQELVSKWDEITLHANPDKILVKSWLADLNRNSAIVATSITSGVIHAANVIEWLALCGSDFCNMQLEAGALILSTATSRATFKAQPVNRHQIDRIAHLNA